MDEEINITPERRRCRPLEDNIFMTYRFKSLFLKAITQNISGSGLMFEGEKKISIGDILDIELYQPTDTPKTMIFMISLNAKVIWIKRIKRSLFEEGENKYRIGVCFTDISSNDRDRINQYVSINLR
jgi:c-di-GMP-binding flagellar brake protein YcgR